MTGEADPLIVTAAFDHATATEFQTLRDRHFPPRINIVPAHLTLFHSLPGAELAAVTARLAAMGHTEGEIAYRADGLRFSGRGVALSIAAPRLVLLRNTLAFDWRAWLTNQDQQPFRPHVTIQNKVDPVAARALHARLDAAPPEIRGRIVGLDLWHYRGGPWERVARHAFAEDA
ncbi:2'-5' RNA ligase family protein [Beijerinckia sp. L45]|uniref:2'-5' RNA ligase family protein n=1 Tax=Beijerinckia sp. L45 TaxID=1641855 RepID=UPI001AED1B34|nr:2'-5' RNA ligase family protein [Beijerinckia sp. L45]